MKTVILAVLSYAILTATAPLCFAAAAMDSRASHVPDATDDFLAAAYFVAVTTSLSALGFGLATSLSASWRRLGAARAIVIAGVLGVISPVAALAVAAVGLFALLPLFRSAPWVAAALLSGLPGVMLGGIAPWLGRAWQSTRPRPL